MFTTSGAYCNDSVTGPRREGSRQYGTTPNRIVAAAGQRFGYRRAVAGSPRRRFAALDMRQAHHHAVVTLDLYP
jgi:hypothetical protein